MPGPMWLVTSVFTLAALSGCGGSLPPAAPNAPATPQGNCPTNKIAFTQPIGCQNDGSVEFCVQKGDAALEAMVKSLAPSVVSGGTGGRAGCNTAVETLFFYPTAGTNPDVCIAHHGAMTDPAWREICQVASLTEIRAIVPTWYE